MFKLLGSNRCKIWVKPKHHKSFSTKDISAPISGHFIHITSTTPTADNQLGTENKHAWSSPDPPAAVLSQDKLLVHEKLNQEYIETLQPLQFQMVALPLPNLQNLDAITSSTNNTSSPSHGAVTINGKLANLKLKQINKEVTALSDGLPLHLDASIFVAVSYTSPSHMMALISGPKGTPYENGLFLFDIYLDNDHPIHPPRVKLLTTGFGTVRFSPNLYSNGEICLSLLGTWAGSANESWRPGTSSILQVLISIQSMIMTAEPYYNEPSFSSLRNPSMPIAPVSQGYNRNLYPQTLRWAMLEQLRNPPEPFADVIRQHFRIKHSQIQKVLAAWSQEISISKPNSKESFDQLTQELMDLIAKL